MVVVLQWTQRNLERFCYSQRNCTVVILFSDFPVAIVGFLISLSKALNEFLNLPPLIQRHTSRAFFRSCVQKNVRGCLTTLRLSVRNSFVQLTDTRAVLRQKWATTLLLLENVIRSYRVKKWFSNR